MEHAAGRPICRGWTCMRRVWPSGAWLALGTTMVSEAASGSWWAQMPLPCSAFILKFTRLPFSHLGFKRISKGTITVTEVSKLHPRGAASGLSSW